jgi:hypothetical protein
MAVRSENLGQDLKAWATDQLHVVNGAAPAEVRSAFLRQFPQDNGGVSHTAREALLILNGRGNAARPVLALDAVEAQLQRELDGLAGRLFSLAIADRKAEWENLRVRGQGFPRVAARLAALRPGLYIMLPPFDRETRLGQLVSAVCEAFVRSPLQRAVFRQTWFAEAKRRDTKIAWANSADRLLKQHPAVAALDSALVAQLADADGLAAKKSKLRRKMQQTARPVASSKRSVPWWAIVLFSFFVLRGLLYLGTSSSKPSPSFVPQQPVFKMPQGDQNDLFKKDSKKLILWKDEDHWKPKLVPLDDGNPNPEQIPPGGQVKNKLPEVKQNPP